MNCEVLVDNAPFSFEISGQFHWGDDEVLYKEKGNIISGRPWKNRGYTQLKLLNEMDSSSLRRSIKKVLLRIFKELRIHCDDRFTLEKYHHTIRTESLHQRVIGETSRLTGGDFGFDLPKLIRKISNELEAPLEIFNPLLNEEYIILRINRPHSLDMNPPHRDGYQDVWKDTLNIWIPIAGCTPQSSLPVIPGSHLWNEKEIYRTAVQGAMINNRRYHVPGIVKTRRGRLHMIRPCPRYGEALVFTPFLIHGAALNSQRDTTRFSLELRLFHGNALKKAGTFGLSSAKADVFQGLPD
ncbi:MAG: phytanoyl-CoA dioxygenase [Elusimicrobia bacterium]|nr:MAG: phytanoyl-CoA dioxygenase [Elusimicrobiota bacterium]